MRSLRTLVCLGAVLLGVSSRAGAQEPDVRDIPPLVMLVVDSSGSMEDLPACTCASKTDCTNCAPNCSLSNTFMEPPKDSSGHELKKNRWAVTLEALTGKFRDFQCVPLVRNSLNGFTGYDEAFSIPYHQPWKCASGSRCAYPGPHIQDTNGILDNYRDTLRFGLVTFDGEYTYKGGSDLINKTNFSTLLSEAMPGMWSSGLAKEFRYPGCDQDYLVNSGVRSASATEGGLIALNSTSCASPPCDMYELNDSIQDALLRTRPYAGTPIAASLDDLYEILEADAASDTFAACRKRYAFLITDGAPDKDFRDLRCQCGDEDKTMPCDDPTETIPGEKYKCPYPTAPDAAKRLITGKQIEKLFVLGMSVKDLEAKATLDAIAAEGNTGKALAADDPNTLRSELDNVFGPLLNPVSRSVPAFAVGLTGIQYQISTGFQVSASNVSSEAPPWRGLIERRRFSCATNGQLTSHELLNEDRFQTTLAAQPRSTRVLQTALPPITFAIGDLSKAMVKGDGDDDKCGTGGCVLRKLEDVTITQEILNVSTPADRTKVLDWMYGAAGSARQGRPLGDIYHSSPALVGPPKDEPADDAYTLFRDQPEVRERPLMMYITTNDGILHAFGVEDRYPVPGYPITNTGRVLLGGQELWGFVPPLLLSRLKDQMTAHQFNLDGTPVVKDVFFKRETSASATKYHTVLITGMRGGGRGYIALDVTDPFAPKFLWQFTDPDMGLTYGQPAIVQATFDFKATSNDQLETQTRAVAILSGGVGQRRKPASTDAIGCDTGVTPVRTPAMLKSGSSDVYKSFTMDPALSGGVPPVDHRKAVQCWERQGRALYFVDVETGKLIKKVFDNDDIPGNGIMFPSPVVGTPTAYQDAVATVADRGFVIDADGVIWRIDMKSKDPVANDGTKGWTVRPFHDLFWDKPVVDGGETTYERPILSLDEKRRVVVIVGTGDTDNFEKPTADNRIVSLTEVATSDPDDPDDYQALINWELRNEDYDGNGLVPTEMVTGSMALFEGQLFAATFISKGAAANACEYGSGRKWSLSYILPDKNDPNRKYGGSTAALAGTYSPLLIPIGAAEQGVDSDASLYNIDDTQARKNLLIQGLGTTQRLTCNKPADPLFSYFSPTLASIEQTEQPAIWVVAQASKGDKRANSMLGTVQTKVARPITFSRITSWAASID